MLRRESFRIRCVTNPASASSGGADNQTISLTAGRVLVLVENLPVPSDRRVWQECVTLTRAGFEVTVICPQGAERDRSPFEQRGGIEIRRYPPKPADASPMSYVREYIWALWQISRLVRRIARRSHIDVVHACNPPDFLLVAALSLRRGGTRFIFDHHDLVPELYLSRFGRRNDLLYRVLCWVERLNFRLADVVISTNESYREIALTRGGKDADDVFVVRNAPDPRRFRPVAPDPSLKRGKPNLLAYVGVMGPQDGLDHALRSLVLLKARRQDWHAVFVGDGDVLPEMRGLAGELDVADMVEFTGWLDEAGVVRVLSTADVCLAPDPKNPLNDLSTMTKVAEYMAMARPVVSYDLRESRATAGEAAEYAEANNEDDFANHIEALLDDPSRRAALGATGRARVEQQLSWEHSAQALLAAYERALAERRAGAKRR